MKINFFKSQILFIFLLLPEIKATKQNLASQTKTPSLTRLAPLQTKMQATSTLQRFPQSTKPTIFQKRKNLFVPSQQTIPSPKTRRPTQTSQTRHRSIPATEQQKKQFSTHCKSAAKTAGGFAAAYALYSQLNKIGCLNNSSLGKLIKLGVASTPAIAGILAANQTYAKKRSSKHKEKTTTQKALQVCGSALAGVAGLGAAYVALNGIDRTKTDLFEIFALDKITESFCHRWPNLREFFEDREFKKHLSTLVTQQNEDSFVKLAEYMLETNRACGKKFVENIATSFNEILSQTNNSPTQNQVKLKNLSTKLLTILQESTTVRNIAIIALNKAASEIANNPRSAVEKLTNILTTTPPVGSNEPSIDKDQLSRALTELLKELNNQPEKLAQIDQLLKQSQNNTQTNKLKEELLVFLSKVGPWQTRTKAYRWMFDPRISFNLWKEKKQTKPPTT